MSDGSRYELAPTIDTVREFWNSNPLWTGESTFEPGTRLFFEEHRQVCREDCFAGHVDDRIFTPTLHARVLDLGCGIGFWLVEFWERGYRNLTGADLSQKSLEIARQRCEVYDVSALLRVANAEALDFETESFDHVNCQGVIHHTPNTQQALNEIARVLRPGGTASVSVYYRNIVLRHWHVFRPLAKFAASVGSRLRGRGREGIYALADADEIVRHYDGHANPVGKAYTRQQFEDMAREHFEITAVYYHFFPARSLPVRIPAALHRFLDRRLPFMIYLNLRRREVG